MSGINRLYYIMLLCIMVFFYYLHKPYNTINLWKTNLHIQIIVPKIK